MTKFPRECQNWSLRQMTVHQTLFLSEKLGNSCWRCQTNDCNRNIKSWSCWSIEFSNCHTSTSWLVCKNCGIGSDEAMDRSRAWKKNERFNAAMKKKLKPNCKAESKALVRIQAEFVEQVCWTLWVQPSNATNTKMKQWRNEITRKFGRLCFCHRLATLHQFSVKNWKSTSNCWKRLFSCRHLEWCASRLMLRWFLNKLNCQLHHLPKSKKKTKVAKKTKEK